MRLKEELLNKKKRLTKAEREYKELCRNMTDLLQNREFLRKSEDQLESVLRDKAREKGRFEKDIKVRKKEYFKVE